MRARRVGNITVTADNACGSSSAQTLVVTVTPYPAAAFSSMTNLLAATFTDQSSGATSWFWTFGDQNTSTLQSPTHTYSVAGTYNVCLIATSNGCTDTVCQLVSVISVGIENGFEMQVSVSPNPSNGLYRLTCEELLEGQIFDAPGRVVSTARYAAGTHSIDLTGVADGVYMLKLNNESSVYWVKLVKGSR